MADYRPNPFATRELAVTPAMQEAMEEHAKAALEPAQSLALIGHTGDYQRGIKTSSGVYKGLAVGRLLATHFTSAWIEFGTSKWDAHAILRQACDAAGLKLTTPGKEV